MLITLGVWMFLGLLGSIMIALGTLTDGEGLDVVDVFILSWLTLAGPCVLIVGIPFFCYWVSDKIKDLE